MREEVLRMERVTYWEQGVAQLEDFDLNLFAGEIVGMVPVSGHGLTALTELLQNNLPLHHGYVYYREELINNWRTPNPRHNRIGVIQSVSSLVGGLTVADNIFVLKPGFRYWLIRPRLFIGQLQPLLDELDVEIRADAYADELTLFQRFVVELLKAVTAGSRLILLRDVGTFISESELAKLHAILRHYTALGISFLYISFHFEELAQICDRTAIFFNGRITKVLRPGEAALDCVKDYDHRVRRQMFQRKAAPQAAPPALLVDRLTGGQVEGLSFSAAPGECVVLQDLDNRVFHDLLALLQGDLSPAGGEITLSGRPFAPGRSRALAILAERPYTQMLFPDLSYFDNLCFTLDHRLPELWRSRRVRAGIQLDCGSFVDEALFSRKPERLSKREKCDLIYHRVLLQHPDVCFCLQPFKSADMELRMHIWGLLDRLMAKGIAVVILAVNLSDSMSLADQIGRAHV